MFLFLSVLLTSVMGAYSFDESRNLLRIENMECDSLSGFQEYKDRAVQVVIVNSVVQYIRASAFSNFLQMTRISVTAPGVVVEEGAIRSHSGIDVWFELESFTSENTFLLFGVRSALNSLTIHCTKNLIIKNADFARVTVSKLDFMGGDITFENDAMAEIKGCKELLVSATNRILFGERAFASSNIQNVKITGNCDVEFMEKSFAFTTIENEVIVGIEKMAIFSKSSFIASSLPKLNAQPRGGIYVAAEAFNGCNSMTSVYIKAYDKIAIYSRGFAECQALVSIELNSDTSILIENHGFVDCIKLDHVTIYAPEQYIDGTAFAGCPLSGGNNNLLYIIIGAAAGVVLIILISICCCCCCCKKKRNDSDSGSV